MHAGKGKSKTRRELVYSSSGNLESTPSEDQCVSAGWFCLFFIGISRHVTVERFKVGVFLHSGLVSVCGPGNVSLRI